MSIPQDELEKALLRESQSYAMCISFARKADSEGYKQVAKLFKTVAESELIHARNHLRVLDMIKTIPDNIKTLLNRKIEEITEIYPRIMERANSYRNKWASKSLCYTEEVGKVLSKVLDKSLRDAPHIAEAEYYVCKACGFVTEDELPEKCPVCGSRKETFKKID